MIFHSYHIHGIGRGKELGFPTINLEIPDNFEMDDGIFAAWAIIHGKPYKGALYHGSIPTFNQSKTSLEIHLIDITDDTIPDIGKEPIEIDVVEKIRDVKRFLEPEDLIDQMVRDIEKVKAVLK